MILNIVLVVCSIVLGLSALINIFGSSLYDFASLKNKRAKPARVNLKQLPFISAVVSASGPAEQLERCLKSLLTNRYPNLEIIVINQTGSKDIKKVVQQLSGKSVNQQIRIIRRPKQTTPLSILRQVSGQARGDIVLALNSQSALIKGALKQVAISFKDSDDLSLLLAPEKTKALNDQTLAGLYRSFKSSLTNMKQKTMCRLNSVYFVGADQAVFYRKVVLQSSTGMESLRPTKNTKMAVSSFIVADAAPVALKRLVVDSLAMDYRQLKALYGLENIDSAFGLKSAAWSVIQALSQFCLTIVRLLLPALLGYFVYLAASLHEPDFLLVSLAALGIYLLFAIYQDEQLGLAGKAKLVALSPIYVSWYCLALLLRYVAFLMASFQALVYGWSKI